MPLPLELVFRSIFIFILLLGMMRTVPAAAVSEPLVMAMEATGAQVEEVTINSWVKLTDSQLSDDQLTKLVQKVMEELGVNPQNYYLSQEQNNRQRCVQAEVVSPDFHILVVAKALDIGISKVDKESYLLITIEDKTKQNHSISQMEKEIRRINEKNGSSPHISTCLIGWLNGTLRDGEQQDLLQKAFEVIDAKIIDKLEAEHLISYTGFTLEIMEWLQVGVQKINLNMAMRYSQYDNRTYVTIGSPLITREY